MKLKKLMKKPLTKLKTLFKKKMRKKKQTEIVNKQKVLKKHVDAEKKIDIKSEEELEKEITEVTTKKSEKFYVNPELFKHHIERYNKTDVINDEVAKYIYDIANRMGFATNFINYTYREEMIGDAIVKMIQALKNKKFDPKKGNPFSYFSMIAFNAFCNRIKKEKRSREALSGYQSQVYDIITTSGLLPDNQTSEDDHENNHNNNDVIPPENKHNKEKEDEDI